MRQQFMMYVGKLLGVPTSQNDLPESSHYTRRNSGDFSCLVFGQPKICNLYQKKVHLSVKYAGRQAKRFSAVKVYLWLVVVIQKDVRRLDVTMDDLRVT